MFVLILAKFEKHLSSTLHVGILWSARNKISPCSCMHFYINSKNVFFATVRPKVSNLFLFYVKYKAFAHNTTVKFFSNYTFKLCEMHVLVGWPYPVWSPTFWFFRRGRSSECGNGLELWTYEQKLVLDTPAKYCPNPSRGSRDIKQEVGGLIQFDHTLYPDLLTQI